MQRRKADQPADRVRFTLAHELGHLVMHKFPSSNMEDEANIFASSFLMPAADIRHSFIGRNKIDLALLGALKQEWRVSMQSLLMRAKSLGFIDDSRSSYLWRQMSARGLRLREPAQFDFVREEPTILNRLIAAHTGALGYSVDDMALLLREKKHRLQTSYFGEEKPAPSKPRLAIIT